MSLKFSAKAHRYWLDGKPVPGVTTILGKGIPKPALPYWAARMVAEYVADEPEKVDALREAGRDPMVAALKSVPWTRRDQAGLRGTEIHALADLLAHGEEVSVPEQHVHEVTGLAEWLDEFDATPILTERSVAHRGHRYAGRLDFLGTLGALGTETWLLDWKTSSGVYGETALQTAAYAHAEFYVEDDAPDVEHPMPHVDRIGVVHVTPDGSHLYDLGEPAEAFEHFLAAKAVADATVWRDSIIGDPITAPKEIP